MNRNPHSYVAAAVAVTVALAGQNSFAQLIVVRRDARAQSSASTHVTPQFRLRNCLDVDELGAADTVFATCPLLEDFCGSTFGSASAAFSGTDGSTTFVVHAIAESSAELHEAQCVQAAAVGDVGALMFLTALDAPVHVQGFVTATFTGNASLRASASASVSGSVFSGTTMILAFFTRDGVVGSTHGSFSGTVPAGGQVNMNLQGTYPSVASLDVAEAGSVEVTITLTVGGCATAADCTEGVFDWKRAEGGNYFNPDNWSPFGVPDVVDVARFSLVGVPSPIPINAAGAFAAQWRVLNGTYNVTGPAAVFAPSLGEPTLDIEDFGHLMLTGSTLTSVRTVIGAIGGSSFMDVTNPGTVLENETSIEIGNGLLDVTAGGVVKTDELLIGTVPGGAGRVRASGVSGGSPSFVNIAGDLSVGGGAGTSGDLTVLNGAFVEADEINIGHLGIGTVLVKDSSNPNDPLDTNGFATLIADRSLLIGGAGQGTLTIEKGGEVASKFVSVDAAGSGTGRLIVDGQGALAQLTANDRLSIVANGPVEVEVKNGGVLQTQSVSIGSAAVRPGAADLTIRGSTTQQDPAHQSKLRVFDVPATAGPAGLTVVGAQAPGQLNILEGASAELEGGLVVGENARGVVVVSGTLAPTSSTLNVTGETRVGVGAAGNLQVSTNSSMVTNGDVKIGVGAGDPGGSVRVEGASRLNVNGTLSVGAGGQGTLDILSSLFSSCDTLLVGGNTPQATGEVILSDASSLTISGNAQVGVDAGAGLIEIDVHSTLSVNGTMTVGGPGGGRVVVNGTIDGTGVVVPVPNGRLEGSGTVTATLVRNAGGFIAPGLSPGTLTIEGDYEQLPGGVLIMEFAGLNPGEFDVLHVTGQTTLGGRLEVHFRGGFSPDDPAVFIQSQDFVEADQTIVGDYDQRIYAYPDIFADFDDDGDKDLRDVATFMNCFGLSGDDLQPACARADWESNDTINATDARELVQRLTGPQ